MHKIRSIWKHNLLAKALGHQIPYFDLSDIQITGWNVKNSVNVEAVYTYLVPDI